MAYDEAYNEPESIQVLFQVVNGSQGVNPAHYRPLTYAMPGDAGVDLMTREPIELTPFQRALVPTGIALALPSGYVGLVHPRSGLAIKQGVTVLNAPGTIDAGYRGEIKVPLINLDPDKTVRFSAGDRIAQLVIQRFVQASFIPATRLPDSARSSNGFGSTGI